MEKYQDKQNINNRILSSERVELLFTTNLLFNFLGNRKYYIKR